MKWIRYFGAALFFLSAIGLILISWPVPETRTEIPLTIGNVTQGKMILTLPEYLRAGETREISLRIEYIPFVNEEDRDTQIKLVNRLEIGSLSVTPKGEGHTLVNPDSVAIFVWKVRCDTVGSNSGLVWLFEEGSDGERFLLLGRKIELLTKNFLGMTFRIARALFIGGAAIGLILFLSIIFRRRFSELKIFASKFDQSE